LNHWQLKQASAYIQQGGILAYPTEAVYGLGCDPYNPDAVLRLLKLKQRSIDKGLILVAANYDQLDPFVMPLSNAIKRKVLASWPGPITWILPARPEVPHHLTGRHTSIAIRVSAHPVIKALCTKIDQALVSTSANISARPSARSALAVHAIFGQKIDYILPGKLSGTGKPSEIRDALSGAIIRPG